MFALLFGAVALASPLNDDIDTVCAKPDTLTVVVASNPAAPAVFSKVQSCTREGNRLTLVQGDKDTIYIDLDHYGTIQIGHGKSTWLRLFP